MYTKAKGLVVRLHRLTSKCSYYKKDADIDVHVKVFQASIIVNREIFKKYIIHAFNYALK